MQVFVRPLFTEALDKDVALSLHTPEQVLVIGERPTCLAVHLGEFDFIEELAGVQDVRETGKRVVKVLHLRSKVQKRNHW